jgi:hypothetical protein
MKLKIKSKRALMNSRIRKLKRLEARIWSRGDKQ